MKKGFSLIEVIFAIVIISISVMSIPMLITQSEKGNQFTIIQESVLAAKTKIGNIISFQWDEKSYDASNDIIRIVEVSNGDSAFSRDTTTRDGNLRVGNIYQDDRRRFRMARGRDTRNTYPIRKA